MRGTAKGPLDVSSYAAPHHLYEASHHHLQNFNPSAGGAPGLGSVAQQQSQQSSQVVVAASGGGVGVGGYHHAEVTLKARSPSPSASALQQLQQTSPDAAGGGAASTGFWLASVAGTALPGTTAAAMEAAAAAAAETAAGFAGIGAGQPSMADFMMSADATATGSSMGQHSPGGSSMSPGAHHSGGYHAMMDPHGVQQDASGVNVPEYPWMKEKKTTRKSSQQGITHQDHAKVLKFVFDKIEDLIVKQICEKSMKHQLSTSVLIGI
ncbi:hypothetical protein TKK_0018954 [Trichogramma kaykai]